jgi:DNA-binding CsgD family transcriptional regulator
MELLERDIPLAELDEALRQAVAGNGQVVFISGEAGIGKSSLVEHFTRRPQQSVRVLWGACDALFTPRPLGPLHDIAAQTGGELASLLRAETNRPAIFTACLNEFQSRPGIVVFEDIHWADEATLDLLKFLGRRIQRTLTLLLATYRDDELGPQHPLRLLLGDLATSTATRRLALAPLSVAAVRLLAGERAVDAKILHQQTGGNPFYVTEILATEQGGVPPTVRDAVLARVARLSLSGRAVLNAAAVIGPRIEPWLLAEVVQAEAGAVDESLALGILRAQGEMLAFRHELARQALLDAIPPHQCAFLNQAVLDALKDSPTTQNDVTRLAHHAEAADNREAVLEFAPAAAKEAAAASAHCESAALYALALRYAAHLAPLDRTPLLESYASECFLTAQLNEGIAARRQAYELWREANNVLKQGENLAYLTILLITAGQNAEAEQRSKTAIELLEQLPPGRELALAYRVRATQYLVSRDCRQAINLAEKALALAQQFGDTAVQATAHNVIGTAWLFVDYRQGCEYLEQRLAVAHEAGLEPRVSTIYANLGSGSGELYHFTQARRYLVEGIAYAIERDLDHNHLYMLAWLALTQFHLGHWAEAASAAAEVLRRPDVSAISRIVGLVALGRLHSRRGDPEARAALDEALKLAIQTDTIQRLAPVRSARAEAAWLDGNRQRALEEAHAVYDLAVSRQHPWFTGELAFWRWRAGDKVDVPEWMATPFALHMAGDWQAAAAAWEVLGCPYEQARALADGDSDAQIAALAIFEQLGARPMTEAVRHKLRAAGIQTIPRGPRTTTRENPFGLTNRQVEILELLTQNLTNAEIATRLHISPKTVDHHVSAVLARLDVHSREEAAELARRHPDL